MLEIARQEKEMMKRSQRRKRAFGYFGKGSRGAEGMEGIVICGVEGGSVRMLGRLRVRGKER